MNRPIRILFSITAAGLFCCSCAREPAPEITSALHRESARRSERSIISAPDEMTARATVISEMKHNPANLDLRCLQGYDPAVTKADLIPLSSDTALKGLSLTALNLNDSDIEPIANLKLTSLSLSGNPIHDLHAIKGMTSLKGLELRNTQLNSDGLSVVSSLHDLLGLDLEETPLRDRDLPFLYGLTKLNKLWLRGCPNLTASGIKRLSAKLPNTTIVSGEKHESKKGFGFDVMRKVEAQYNDDKDYEGVDKTLAANLPKWEAEAAPDWHTIVDAYVMRAGCKAKLHDEHAERELLEKALAICKKHIPGGEELAKLRGSCGVNLADSEPAKAITLLTQYDDYFRKHPPDPKEYAQEWVCLRALAGLQDRMGEQRQALATSQRGLTLAKITKPDDPKRTASSLYDIGHLYFMMGRYTDAQAYLKEAVDLLPGEKYSELRGVAQKALDMARKKSS